MSFYVVRRVYKTEESIAGSLETEKNLKKKNYKRVIKKDFEINELD